jgi:hypothetical protein
MYPDKARQCHKGGEERYTNQLSAVTAEPRRPRKRGFEAQALRSTCRTGRYARGVWLITSVVDRVGKYVANGGLAASGSIRASRYLINKCSLP